ncbi:GAF and ANTAR domain-containing protein [Actinophytocola sp.]|uniref:GAF and ANTAR domain-containing protein n=1 Tax=Actinophytocola sp. TaxID=1872138 RepID=UPI0025BD20AA|nr:GAF and ANTAR domain-containing protein [Actinophytocola sp.]
MQDDAWRLDKAEFVDRPPDAPHPAGDQEQSPLARQLTLLTKTLLAADSVAGALEHVVDAAFEVLPDADVVSVTLRSDDGRLHTPVQTNPLAVELDELQYRYGHGPCLDAARTPGMAYKYAGNVAVEPEWPQFGPAAAERGVLSVLSTALVPDAAPPRLSGALNAYSRKLGGLGDAVSRDRALLLATHGSLALAHTEAVRLADLREAQLRTALETRDVIGQAKGILMNRRGLTAEQAFDLLRRTSQELNVKLVEVARTLAARHAELDPPGH